MAKIILSVVLFLWGNNLFSQNSLQRVKLSELVPEVNLKLVNKNNDNKVSAAKLSDYSGRPLILNFWSPHCLSCVHDIASWDSLQIAFKNKISILFVSSSSTGSDIADIRKFIKGYKQRIKNGFTMSSVVEDTVLTSLFPHQTLSYCVWIDANGKMIGAGNILAGDITSSDIEAVLSGGHPARTASSTDTIYDFEKKLLDSYLNKSINNNIFSYSVITGKINQLQSDLGRISINGPRIIAINQNVLNLYKYAFYGAGYYYLSKNRIFDETKEQKFRGLLHNVGAENDSVFSYECFLPDTSLSAIFQKMQTDLESYFKVTVRIEKKKQQCLVLKIIDTALFKTKGGIEGNTLYEDLNQDRLMINQPLNVLTDRLNKILDIPVLNETGIHWNVDLRMPSDLTNFESMSEELKKQGLLYQKAEREINVFVLLDAFPVFKYPFSVNPFD